MPLALGLPRSATRWLWLALLASAGSGCTSVESSSTGPQPAEPCPGEGATEECYPGAPATERVGQCTPGSRTCTDGRWTPCTGYTLPSAETCDDGLDDDCDGVIDQGCPCELGTERPCYSSEPATQDVGTCRSGLQGCVTGVWSSECTGEVGPVTESCNEQDDDCNGLVDEGCDCLDGATRACYTGPDGTEGVGPCHGGQVTCQSGQWPASCDGQVGPAPEGCNGVDDDCNGQVDDGNPGGGGGCTTELPGPCAQGTLVCSGGGIVCQPNAPTSDPACQPCVGCLMGYADCNLACQYLIARPGGSCGIPNSTDPHNCCACLPANDCSACVANNDCPAACQAAGYATGFCGIDGSTDPTACCACLP